MFLPVVVRELRALVRQPQFRRRRWQAGVAGLALFGLAFGATRLVGGPAIGPALFQILAWGIWIACLLAGVSGTAGTICSERRKGTLGLLFLTPLGSWDIVLGKLTSGAAIAVQGLLAVVPMAMCCLLLGGVNWLQVGTSVIVWANSLFFALALGMFISSTQTDDRRATLLTLGCCSLLCLVPASIVEFVPSLAGSRLGSEIGMRLISPAFSIQTVAGNFFPLTFDPFPLIASLAWIHVVAWGLLWATAWRLRWVALASPPRRMGTWLQTFNNWWQYGSHRTRSSRRRRLLDRHPIVWLGLRHRQKGAYVWVMFISIAVILSGVVWWATALSFIPEMLALYTFATLGILKLWLVSEVCARLVDDRRSGALELMLTTPTSHREWIHGQAAALRTLFWKPALAAGLWVVGIAVWHINQLGLNGAFGAPLLALPLLATVAALDFGMLFWGSLWHSLLSQSVSGALRKIYFQLLLLPNLTALAIFLGWLWVVENWPGIRMRNDLYPGSVSSLILWAIFNLAIGGIGWVYFRSQVLRRFREIVASGHASPEAALERIPASPAGAGARPHQWVWLRMRRHPVISVIAGVVAGLSLFVSLRQQLWTQRVVAAQREMWLAGLPREIPQAAPPAEPPGQPVVDFLAEARLHEMRTLQFKPRLDLYATTNEANVDTSIAPYLKLAQLTRNLPDTARIPNRQFSGIWWQPPALPFNASHAAARVLSIQAYRAARDGHPDDALDSLRAIFRLARLTDESLTAPHTIVSAGFTLSLFHHPILPSDDRLLQGVEALRQIFQSPGGAALDLGTVSHLLTQADSWTHAHRRIRALPAYLNNLYEQPEHLGVPNAAIQISDLITVKRRVDAIDVFKMLPAIVRRLDDPEGPRLQGMRDQPRASGDQFHTGIVSLRQWLDTALDSYVQHGEAVGVLRCAQASVAVEEFRRLEHRLPRDHPEISTWRGRPWPVDPFSGEPVRFEPQADGYAITAWLNQAQVKTHPGRTNAPYRFQVVSSGK